ncbi:ATP-binding protein [Neobacillus dielmonensis]|uniref:ATP-binding protein n=1 Tax=Neobacillus dielmonensis TaxID=1347369 RepID=UPI0005A6F91C|nr:HAMP domain-containing sensor histidine kinase [Neobacillus dielmonensis]
MRTHKDIPNKYPNPEIHSQKEAGHTKQINPFFFRQSRLAQLGEMFETIGPQWQQPLNHLSLLIQDIREALEFGELNDQYIDHFITESMLQINQMSQTIHDLRKLYKQDKSPSSFSVADSIEEALALFSPCLQQHQIIVNFVHRGQYMAFGYPHQFSQVVLGIITRMKDSFLEKDIYKRMIDINLEDTDNYIIAELSANAGGMDQAVLDQTFELAATSKTKTYGLDFSLYISKLILENMGGSMTVAHTKTGTKFCLFVPKNETFPSA